MSEPEILAIAQLAEETLPNGKYKNTVTATGGTTPYKYKRYPGTGYQTSNVFNNVSAGSYLFIVRDDNLCEDTVSASVPGAGIYQSAAANRQALQAWAPDGGGVENADQVALYPNPAVGTFHLSFGTSFTAGSLAVFDLNGRLLLERRLEPDTRRYNCDLTGLPSGLYLVQLRLDGRQIARKLMVENP